ncbi:hypothetical protein ElyMa_003534400 [Elysia marginata]|uniref:Ig-like domain-containing protein n=1 Tax=Elysia marginata TaxID=1093978 RepID=A0AAV4EHQ6_9GAST|nr:hypothetical protein ElyMa_003534400 [Elysia marginata]
MVLTVVSLCVLGLGLSTVSAEENYQQWSVQTTEDDSYSFYCNDTLYPVFVNPTDNLTWRRHGHDVPVQNDDFFELGDVSGIQNMMLTVKKATHEMSGIYFCEIRNPSGAFVGRIIKGLNIAGFKYKDFLDKYERKLITGVITAAAVLFIIVGVGLIDHFRYYSDEERREKQEAKEQRIRKQAEMKKFGHDNPSMDIADTDSGHVNGFQTELNTQL